MQLGLFLLLLLVCGIGESLGEEDNFKGVFTELKYAENSDNSENQQSNKSEHENPLALSVKNDNNKETKILKDIADSIALLRLQIAEGINNENLNTNVFPFQEDKPKTTKVNTQNNNEITDSNNPLSSRIDDQEDAEIHLIKKIAERELALSFLQKFGNKIALNDTKIINEILDFFRLRRDEEETADKGFQIKEIVDPIALLTLLTTNNETGINNELLRLRKERDAITNNETQKVENLFNPVKRVRLQREEREANGTQTGEYLVDSVVPEISNNESRINKEYIDPIALSRINNETEINEEIIDKNVFLRLRRDENETKIIKETEERVLKKTNVSETKPETCGGIFTQPQFIIETPNYPSNYQNNLNCLFIFKGLLCATNYTLQFLDFNVEDTLGCVADRLEIKDKDALCGVHEGVRSYVAKNGVLELSFVSNGNLSSRGFRILVSRSTCLRPEDAGNDLFGNRNRPLYPSENKPGFGKPLDGNDNLYPNRKGTDSSGRPLQGNDNLYPNRKGTDSSGRPLEGNDNLYPNRKGTDLGGKPLDGSGNRPDFYDSNQPGFYESPLDSKRPDLFGNPHSNVPDFINRGAFPNGTNQPKSGYLPPGEPPYPPSGTKPNHYLPPSSSYNPPANNPNRPKPYYPNYPPYPPSNTKQRACCAATYSAKRFLITSPGFPHSNHHPTECTFTIYKTNPRVCRMRIILRYFSLGDPDCTKGHLQIDGKLLCGCRTGMRLLSPFDFPFGNTKVFKLKTLPVQSSIYSGFAIEIIQDECPERYLPSGIKFEPYKTEFFEPIDLGFKPRVVKHVYFFDSPHFYDDSFDLTYTYNKPRDIEESTYVDTSDLSPNFPKTNQDITQCALWGLNQYNELTSGVLWKTMPKCNELNVYPEVSKCKDYNFIKGYFQSPGYPYYYPKNLNICYRFSKQRGFCKIRLTMLDFQVDQSYDCGKDYLLINGNFRYCGQSLANTFTLFDMIGKNYEEIKFITDGQSSGRGFRGIYEQIPCEGEAHPHHHHPHTTPPTKTTTTPEPPCSRTIDEGYFTVDIYDYGKDTCDFVVRKSSEDVRCLDISFSTFDLDCQTEYLLIDGEKFCGNLSGKRMSFEFLKDEIDIKYKRFSLLSRGAGLKLHLVGRQVSENCEVPIPPAQRILSTNRRSGKQNDGNSTIVVLKKMLKEVCGVVLDAKKINTTKSLCETLTDLNDKPLPNCNSISDKTHYVPYNKSDKLELKFESAQQARNVEFKQVTCDNKFIL